MKVDELLKNHLGELGRYQLRIALIICIDAIFSAFYVMSPVFTTAVPDHWCATPLTDSPVLANCSFNDRLHYGVPMVRNKKSGAWQYSACTMYDVANLNASGALPDQLDDVNCGEEDFEFGTHIAGNDSPTNTSALSSSSSPRPNRLLRNISTSGCDKWTFDSSTTMTSEWSLVCQHTWIAKTVASLFLIGNGLGTFIFSWLADIYGRRKVIIASAVAMIVCSAASAFSPDVVTYLVLRFLTAVFLRGKHGFVLAMEYTGPSWRVHVATFHMIMWAVGYVLVAGLAYFVRDWRMFTLAFTLPELAYVVLFILFVPESPRWLLVKKREKQVVDIVQKMARFNKVHLPEPLLIEEEEESDASFMSPLDLFRTPQIRTTTFIMLVCWFTCGIVYYGLSFGVSDLVGDLYVNVAIAGAVEIPAYLGISLVFDTVGHIVPFAASFFLGGAALLGTALTTSAELNWLLLTLSMIGKFCITASFTMIYIIAGEVYPTCIRTQGLYVTSIMARLSASVGPYITLLAADYDMLPPIMYSVLAFVAGGLALWLPEAKGRFMTQTIAEGECFIRDNRLGPCGRATRLRTPIAADVKGEQELQHRLAIEPPCETT